MVAVTWSKLSDDFPDDCWTLSDAAFRLHVEGLCWSNRKLLDCRIPKDDLRRFAKTPGAVAELLAVGWWSDDGDAYVIRHHADYQRTREQVVAQQEANRRNGRRGGRPPKPKPPTKTALVGESPSETGTQRDGTGRGSYGSEDQGHGESWPRVIPPGSAAGPPPADESPRDLDSAVGRVDLGRVWCCRWGGWPPSRLRRGSGGRRPAIRRRPQPGRRRPDEAAPRGWERPRRRRCGA